MVKARTEYSRTNIEQNKQRKTDIQNKTNKDEIVIIIIVMTSVVACMFMCVRRRKMKFGLIAR